MLSTPRTRLTDCDTVIAIEDRQREPGGSQHSGSQNGPGGARGWGSPCDSSSSMLQAEPLLDVAPRPGTPGIKDAIAGRTGGEVAGGLSKGGLAVPTGRERLSQEFCGRPSAGVLGAEALEEEQEAMYSEEPGIRVNGASFGNRGDSRVHLASFQKPGVWASKEVAKDGDLTESEEHAEAQELELLDASIAHRCCCHCQLPLGDEAYAMGDEFMRPIGDELMHGECMATFMLHKIRKARQDAEQEHAEIKRKHREEFDIGWKIQRIPRNDSLAAALPCPVPTGLCCLALDQASNSVGLAATLEPQAAVNLQYLFTALRVRCSERGEPFFSLDPLDDDSSSSSDPMQTKRFEPAWLAGTSVGEVLFQADYHLKELSMGNYEQPVIGMRSVLDMIDNLDLQWKARAWFVVRKAEVQISEDNVLLPSVRMGVEAREQTVGEDGLVDVPVTDPNNPMVKYAESFSHNFQLIAERRSVVYHLRELAKASVLAKFLVESGVNLDDAWLAMGGKVNEACCLRVPQLWKERTRCEICMRDGEVIDMSRSSGRFLTLYGGVHFGLDNFQLAGSRRPIRAAKTDEAAPPLRQPRRSVGRAAPQLQQPRRHSTGPPSQVAAGVSSDRCALFGPPQPARLSAGTIPSRQAAYTLLPARHSIAASLAPSQPPRPSRPVGMTPGRFSTASLVPPHVRSASAFPCLGLDKFTKPKPTGMKSSSSSARELVERARDGRTGLGTEQVQRSFQRWSANQAPASASFGGSKFESLLGAAPRIQATCVSASLGGPTLRGTFSSDGGQPQRMALQYWPAAASPGRVFRGGGRAVPERFDRALDAALGVDLSLDEFNLSAPETLPLHSVSVPPDSGTNTSKVFWLHLDGEAPSMFGEDDRALLRKVFDPALSDRRGEGDRFVPPETSRAHFEELRSLVEEEELVQRNRREHFFSNAFAMREPGPLFPFSWAASVEIFHEDAATERGDSLHLLPEYKLQPRLCEQMLESTAPIFDNVTEDGTRFCVYRVGTLELRTTQGPGGTEAVGAVFSRRTPAEQSRLRASIRSDEKIAKATEYVERIGEGACHRYVVLETEQKNIIVAEHLSDGQLKTEENPEDLEDRNSLAKVLRFTACSGQKTAEAVRAHQWDPLELVHT